MSWWWLPVWLLVISAPVAMGVSVMYHRVLTHSAARVSPWVAYPLVAVAAPAGTPIGWVGNHRNHHRVTDTEEDPHSPVRHGFWVAHAGWYLGTANPVLCALYSVGGPIRMLFDAWWRPRTGMRYARLAPDIARDPFYRWLSRPVPYAVVVVSHVALTWTGTWWLFGPWALPILYVLQVGYFAVGDGVNSWAHGHGKRPFRSDDESGNVAWLGWLTAGDGGGRLPPQPSCVSDVDPPRAAAGPARPGLPVLPGPRADRSGGRAAGPVTRGDPGPDGHTGTGTGLVVRVGIGTSVGAVIPTRARRGRRRV